MSNYDTIRALREGKTVEVEGVFVKMDGDGEVKAGDSYVAERNTGPKLLLAKTIDPRGWIRSTCDAYPFDIGECVKVCEADPPA